MKNFYLRRAFRILPPAVVYLLTLAGLRAAGYIVLTWSDWGALLFISNYLPGRTWYTGHFWSLSVEEHFYLFWPFIMAYGGLRRSLAFGLAAVAAVAVWRPWNLRAAGSAWEAPLLLQHTDMRLDYIMLGCAAALVLALWPGLLPWAARLGSSLALLAFTGALMALGSLHAPFDTRTIQAAILALMTGGSALNGVSVACKVLCLPPVLFIGRISYSIYIWQEIFLTPSGNPFLSSWPALAGRLALIVGTATLSYFAIERPAIAWGRSARSRTLPAPE